MGKPVRQKGEELQTIETVGRKKNRFQLLGSSSQPAKKVLTVYKNGSN
jgi:hypothetical protein